MIRRCVPNLRIRGSIHHLLDPFPLQSSYPVRFWTFSFRLNRELRRPLAIYHLVCMGANDIELYLLVQYDGDPHLGFRFYELPHRWWYLSQRYRCLFSS